MRKIVLFLQEVILSILCNLIVQRQNEKFYFIILVTGLQSIEGSSERAGKLEPNDFHSFSNYIVYLLSKFNKLIFKCQTMKQFAWHFVRMEEEINNKGKKIFASTCIGHFLSFEVVFP